jgi:hypothetical protein
MRRCAGELFQVYAEDEFSDAVVPETPLGPTRAPTDERQGRRLAVTAMLVAALAAIVWVILVEMQPLAGRRVRAPGAGHRRHGHLGRLRDASIARPIGSVRTPARATANARAPRSARRRGLARGAGAGSVVGRIAVRDDARAAAIARHVSRPAATAVASVAPAPDRPQPEFGFER